MKGRYCGLIPLLTAPLCAGPAVTVPHIKVDQFGYPPVGAKVAVITNPVQGYNAPDPFIPSADFEVRRWSDDSVAFRGPVVPWSGGGTHTQSGDDVWWFDFSALEEVGSFYLFDPVNGVGSHRFEIDPNVYSDVLTTAMRTSLYQRCGQERTVLHAGSSWADAGTPCPPDA